MSLSVNGRAKLIADPRHGTTQTGTRWCNATVRVTNWKKVDDGWSENGSYVATLVAWNDLAPELARFAKGDDVEIAGKVKDVSVWTPKQGGEPRASLAITLDSIAAGKGSGNRGDKPTVGPGEVSRVTTPQNQGDADWPRPATPGGAKGPQTVRTPADAKGVQSVETPAPASSPAQVSVGTGPTQDQPTADVLDFRRGAMGRLTRQHRNNRLTGSSA